MEDNGHEDYTELKPTERHQVAIDLAGWVKTVGLGTVEQQDYARDPNGRFYAVPFGAEQNAWGTVYVYGPSYVRVSYHASLDGLPQNDERLYASVEEAMAFLSLAFVERNAPAALALPLHHPRRRRKAARPEAAPD